MTDVSQAVAAAKQLVFVARSGDDSARWGETYVKIRAKHLESLVVEAEAREETRPEWASRESVLAKAAELDDWVSLYSQGAAHSKAQLDPAMAEVMTLASSLALQTRRMIERETT